MEEQKTERFYNQKTLVASLAVVGTATYLMGRSQGVKRAYVEGLKDGIVQGLAEGRLEGYVSAMSNVATIFQNIQN